MGERGKTQRDLRTDELEGLARDVVDLAREARDKAGRSETGRRLAIAVTEAEKLLAWVEYVNSEMDP